MVKNKKDVAALKLIAIMIIVFVLFVVFIVGGIQKHIAADQEIMVKINEEMKTPITEISDEIIGADFEIVNTFNEQQSLYKLNKSFHILEVYEVINREYSRKLFKYDSLSSELTINHERVNPMALFSRYEDYEKDYEQLDDFITFFNNAWDEI